MAELNPQDGELLSAAGSIAVGPCPRCEREVVAYPVEEDGTPASLDQSGYACVHCDGPIREVAWCDDSELERLGYSLTDPQLAGCGTGCMNGGCSPAALKATGITTKVR